MNNQTSASGLSVLVVVCFALFFGVLNGSAVAVVLPEIGDDLGIASSDLSWVLSGFLLTYGVAIPFYGRLARRYGTRNLFLLGVAVFAIGSALSALATGLGTLLFARTIQAAGGAAVPGLGMTLASRAFPEERRGVVLGIVSATMGLGAAAGPLAAGVISELADWRWLFALSVLAAASVPVGLRVLAPDDELATEPLDLAGGALFGTGVASLLYVVSAGSQAGWGDTVVVGFALASISAFGAFVVHQRREADPFIPRTLLRSRTYVQLTVVGFAITFANLAVQIGLPFILSELHDLSTLQIGLVLLPAALTTAGVGVLAGRIVDRAGARAPILIGGLVMAAATLTLSTLVGGTLWSLVSLTVVFAVGFALVNTPLAAAVSLTVEPDDLATALSLNTMMFFIGGSFGATLFTSIGLGRMVEAINPLHAGSGGSFSDALLVLIVPITVPLVLARRIPARPPAAETGGEVTGPDLHDLPIQTGVTHG